MKLLRIALLLALAVVGATSASASASRPSGVVGHVYVNDNTAGVNTISAFDRHTDGSLSPIPGSPFTTDGAGTGTGIGSQGALQESSDGRYLLAVDAGSNQISALRILPHGELGHVGGGAVSSGGNEPVSIAVSGRRVYVANAGDGASNYTGFTLNPGGHLRPIPSSTVALPDGSAPGDVLFNGNGTSLVGVRVNTSLIDSFAVSADGHLTAAPNSPIPAQGPGPFGSEFRPTNSSQLFVSNAHGGPEAATVSAFSVAGDGTLTSIGASPFPDNQTAACWVEISHDGRFLFTVNTASNTVSRYSIEEGGSLELLGSTALEQAKAGAEDARLTPDGRTLWIVETGAKSLAALAVEGGKLTAIPGSATGLGVDTAPFGIVVT
jgi:6-phosphogluconolactonase